jgi:D-3-phosphoglycerate dehydrogenase
VDPRGIRKSVQIRGRPATPEGRLPKVLVTDADVAFLEILELALRPLRVQVELASSIDEATLERAVSNAAVVIVDRAPVGESVIALAAGAGCLAILRSGIGYENVDLDAAERHGVPVANVPDYCLDEVADHTMALLLGHARRITETATAMRRGGWETPRGQVARLAGRQLGLIGVGRIGRRVAIRALAFGLVVAVHDPLTTAEIPGVKRVERAELYATSDYISLHAPLTEETRHMVDQIALGAMRLRPLLINTSRGGLVDLEAVTTALEAGVVSGVALDVFEDEPLADDHPLRKNAMATLTPHMAYYSIESERDLAERVAGEVARALTREPLLNAVTRLRIARHRHAT